MKIHCKYDELVPWRQLKPHPKNRNKHPEDQIERLTKLIRYQGVRAPIIVSKLSGYIVKGHGTLLSLKPICEEENVATVPVAYQHFDDEDQEYLFVQSDNAIASWAELDLSGINSDLGDLGPVDIDLLGIRDFEITPEDKYDDADADAVPEPPKEAKTKRGELWLLGKHRLLIDDCTDAQAVARLMGDEKAGMVFTDPPYGMAAETDWSSIRTKVKSFHSVDEAGGKYRPIQNDEKPFDPSHIFEFFRCKEIFLWGADYYAERIPERNSGSWVVWDKCTTKDGNLASEGAFGSNFELCWSKGRHKRELARFMHKGFASCENDKREHPSQKPVKLAEWFFERWGKDAQIIVDLYGGSGSTLIACEKTGKQCRMAEIDPLYVDVIISRWCKFTGQEAHRQNPDGTTTPWSQVKGEG
jgi:DNA modification methylase